MWNGSSENSQGSGNQSSILDKESKMLTGYIWETENLQSLIINLTDEPNIRN